MKPVIFEMALTNAVNFFRPAIIEWGCKEETSLKIVVYNGALSKILQVAIQDVPLDGLNATLSIVLQ